MKEISRKKAIRVSSIFIGIRLPVQGEEWPHAKPQSRKAAKSQSRKVAKSQSRKVAKSQSRKVAKSPSRQVAKSERRRFGWALREFLASLRLRVK